MSQKLNFAGLVLIQSLLGIAMLLVTNPLSAGSVRVVPVNIFGDGNPLNGVEDDREQVKRGNRESGGPVDRRMSAGTITCDGKFRGTAMVVDTREFAPGLDGVVLVSAAHVLYDLGRKRLFRRCQFHFMGLNEDTGYSVKINFKNVRLGDFDPGQATGGLAFGEGDWAFLYLSKPWRNFYPDQSLELREFSFTRTESYQQSGGEFRLLAYDSSAGVISESRNCTVFESNYGDIGGGAWKGQLLDDCDSSDGASGGGIVAFLGQQRFMIGIRNGSHWSEQVYPVGENPAGPPDGSVWNQRSNTNFGRAIDAYLLNELKQFIQTLR